MLGSHEAQYIPSLRKFLLCKFIGSIFVHVLDEARSILPAQLDTPECTGFDGHFCMLVIATETTFLVVRAVFSQIHANSQGTTSYKAPSTDNERTEHQKLSKLLIYLEALTLYIVGIWSLSARTRTGKRMVSTPDKVEVEDIDTKKDQQGKRAPKKKASERRKALREKLWPEISDEHLWIRTQRIGFTTIPRTMSIIGRILDALSGKGFPVFQTYFALWCHVYDEGYVEIRDPRGMAFEAGFSGPRAESVWKTRMRRLEELGFIQAKPGLSGDFHYVLLPNPLQVIEASYQKRPKDTAYMALLGRLAAVGADDIDY